MKRTIRFLTALLVLLTTGSNIMWAQPTPQWDGSGTVDDPYLIKTNLNLRALAYHVTVIEWDYADTYFKLDADLEYSNTEEYLPIGNGAHKFSGHFDGGGHTIKGIRYTYTDAANANIGLFGETDNGSISNLTLENCQFISTNSAASVNVGVVVGDSRSAISNVRLKNCKAITKEGHAAGIVAYQWAGTISYCIVEDTEISVIDGSTLHGIAGGISGFDNGNEVSNNVVRNSIVQAQHAAGILGDAFTGGPANNNYVEDCTVKGSSSAAGISTLAGHTGSYAHGLTHEGNEVVGTTTITATNDDGAAGALFAEKGDNYWDNNYYDNKVDDRCIVKIGTTEYKGSGTKRGYCNEHDSYTVKDYSTTDNPNAVVGRPYNKITVKTNPTGLTATASRYYGIENSVVNITTSAPEGYVFSGWTATSGTFGDASKATTTFTLPDDNVTLTANYVKKLQLKHKLTHVDKVEFYDGGSGTAPKPYDAKDETSFGYAAVPDESNAIEDIDNSDGNDRYIIVHIVPTDDYTNGFWTDEHILFSYETAPLLTRMREPTATTDIDFDSGQRLTLLKRDTYTYTYYYYDENDEGHTVEHTEDRHDGAGWYYYTLSKDHTTANYDTSTLDGFVVPKFNFNIWIDGNHVNQDSETKIITVSRDADDWTAEISLDTETLSFPFDCEDHAPTINGITLKKGGVKMVSLTSDFSNQLTIDEEYRIGENLIFLNAASYLDGSSKCWFKSNLYDDNIYFTITVPFEGSGTTGNPWKINNAANLNMLAKCVNVGQYDFKGKFLEQTASFSMSSITDFVPIGGLRTSFNGSYNGNEKTISDLTLFKGMDVDYTSDVFDGFMPIGLFGRVGEHNGYYKAPGVVENVKLINCTIDDTKLVENTIPVNFAGGIVGLLLPESVIRNSTISNSTIMATGRCVCVGGIAGLIEDLYMTVSARAESKTIERSATPDPDNTIEGCAVDACTISNTMTDGVETSDHTDKNWTGGIVGMAKGGSLSGNRVTGATKITSDINLNVDCPLGAIFGEITSSSTSPVTTLSDNKYVKSVELIRKKGTSTTDAVTITANGYTKRGYWNWTTTPEAWDDINDATEGAMLLVKKATLPTANDNGSKVEFNEVTKGTDRYDFGGDDDFYYAVGQPVTLKVTTGTSTDGDIRTFYDQLTALTVNGSDITTALGFTMPEADATVAATFEPSDWFTIDTDQKLWMSFYHEWTTGGGTSASPVNANYTVTDFAGTETIYAKTITKVNLKTGNITPGDLGGISYWGMPTLFTCKNGLPAKLKFTPVADASTNVTVWDKFKGTTMDKDMREFTNVYVLNGIGDFYYADIAPNDYTLKAHHCYIVLGNIAGGLPARLHISGGEDTGIDDPRFDSTEDNGHWFTIDGRRMDGKPTRKGIYINGGRKVVIK